MAPSQALFPFNRFTGGRKPKPPCRGLGDEMAPAPARCFPPPTISSPPPGAPPHASTQHPLHWPPRQGTGATAAWVKSLGMKAGPAGCSPPALPSLPGQLGAGQKNKKKKRKTIFFQPKPLIHPPASLPEVLAGRRAPASIAGRGDPVPTEHHLAAVTPVPTGDLSQGMLQQQENPLGKKPGFGKNTLMPPKAKS